MFSTQDLCEKDESPAAFVSTNSGLSEVVPPSGAIDGGSRRRSSRAGAAANAAPPTASGVLSAAPPRCKRCRQESALCVVAPCWEDFQTRRSELFLAEGNMRMPEVSAFPDGDFRRAFIATLELGMSFEVKSSLVCSMARLSARQFSVSFLLQLCVTAQRLYVLPRCLWAHGPYG